MKIKLKVKPAGRPVDEAEDIATFNKLTEAWTCARILQAVTSSPVQYFIQFKQHGQTIVSKPWSSDITAMNSLISEARKQRREG